MNIVLLGKGKMGSLVEQLARERGHRVRSHDEFDNIHASELTTEKLRGIDVAIDFTTPDAVLENVEACAKAGVNIVVGTTGWYRHLPHLRQAIEKAGTGFLYAANFSLGVNLFFEITRAAAAAMKFGYSGKIMERHHVHKKDAPSGTAVKLGNVIKDASGVELPIESQREGETVGLHVVFLDSENDSIMLSHDAKSRRGFADGAVRAAEWLKGKRGFYDFKDIWREL